MAPLRLSLLVADPTQRSVLEQLLYREGFEVTSHGEGASFRSAARRAPPDAILLEVGFPEATRGPLVRWIRGLHPETPIVLLQRERASRASLDPVWTGPTALAPLEAGPELLLAIRTATESYRLALRVRSLERSTGGAAWGGVLGRSPGIRALEDELDRVAASEATLLLHGEPGVGKGLVARALHTRSGRRDGPFVPIDLRDLAEDWASELLGREGAAVAGASTGRPGFAEAAAGGTLSLRGVSALHPRAQAALLEVLRERRVTRVGGTEPRDVDFRLILVQRRPPEGTVAAGRLREDLYGEVRGVQVRIPPLRERKGDIPLLMDHFIRVEAPERAPIRVTREAADRLVDYRWPGNVRELHEAVCRALVTCDEEIGLEDLPDRIRRGGEGLTPDGDDPGPLPPETLDLRALERWAVHRAVASCGGNMTEAAARLGIGRTTLYRKLDAYGLR
jgi:DNA-binding NtrC family response regulator